MTVKERVEDISKRTGLSEEIVRSVIDAECESLAESLLRGERSPLLGRCICIPLMKHKLVAGDNVPNIENRLSVKIIPSKSLIDRLNSHIDEAVVIESEEEAYQIPKLATLQIEGLI